jgi:hypothetical protein
MTTAPGCSDSRTAPGSIRGASDPLLPFHIATAPPSLQQGECTNDVGHQWADQHAMWNHGKLDSWVARHLVSDPGGNGRFAGITMGYYQGSPARDHSGDVDLYWALADNSTICDNYHCSVIGGTDINRLYSVTGTADPDCWDGGGQFFDTKVSTSIQTPGADLGTARKWRPYPELLQAAGVTWTVYGTPDAHLGDNVLRYFPQYRPVGGDTTLAANASAPTGFPPTSRRTPPRDGFLKCRGCSAASSTPTTLQRPSSGAKTMRRRWFSHCSTLLNGPAQRSSSPTTRTVGSSTTSHPRCRPRPIPSSELESSSVSASWRLGQRPRGPDS